MKKVVIVLILLIIAGIFLFGCSKKDDPLLTEGTTYYIPFQDENREVNVHTPEGYDLTKQYPVVLVLHGGGGRWVSAKRGSQMNDVADKYGFIAVYPNSSDEKSWNVGARGKDGRQSDYNDIAYIQKIITLVGEKYSINPDRIYATGLSNGGMMSYNLACNLPGTIKAAAPVAGALMYHPCEPTLAIPIMAVNGVLDPVVPYPGGKSGLVADDLRPSSESIKYFTDKFCPAQTPTITFQNNDSNCITYSGCQNGAKYTFCTIANGGHTWPGGVYESDLFFYPHLVGPISDDMFAAEEIWKFFDSTQ